MFVCKSILDCDTKQIQLRNSSPNEKQQWTKYTGTILHKNNEIYLSIEFQWIQFDLKFFKESTNAFANRISIANLFSKQFKLHSWFTSLLCMRVKGQEKNAVKERRINGVIKFSRLNWWENIGLYCFWHVKNGSLQSFYAHLHRNLFILTTQINYTL